ncbi:TfdA family taurine catabolism dioxygenase TauD [Microdochium trichocladiopsis]|uniref:TfdA family taurine catabolism dioxygenase TauD n=1 Tax=Microdochium trichocladiopsis TaxID=1682393 RepID=A0A9P8XX68_9PEZI|nr:TfdA family taurine catabolism dioxygenase TauD [Microdochium trichocladiopsis]KAH7024481.1 TfdA family taurine catabolism dioxygenase TauD [Microdochium trichocladiopsis]
MAPSATTTQTLKASELPKPASSFGQYKVIASYTLSEEKELGENGATYPHYLPTWSPEQKYPPLQPFEHVEHGKDADTSYPDLLPAGTKTTDLTPTIGTEVHGIQVSSLSKAGKDQLARFVAERKVVAFRDQDFADLPIQDALDFGAYYGRHHIHPSSGSPKDYPEIHLVHRGADDKTHETFFETRTSSVAWHSDVSYEAQPPGTTLLYILDRPETGGDTLFVNAVEAYNRLSPLFRERLHGLKAVHSGVEQAAAARARGSIVRREPVSHEHPIIRTHPATGEKAIYVNPQFTRYIVGLKKEESDALLKFLYDHLAYGADFQARVKWQPGTLVLWDNRVTQHSALVDWTSGQRRHLARITPQAERPFETPFEG